jgi:hypothetical protein
VAGFEPLAPDPKSSANRSIDNPPDPQEKSKKNRMDDAVSTKFVNLSSFKTKKETVCANKQSPILKQTLTLEG